MPVTLGAVTSSEDTLVTERSRCSVDICVLETRWKHNARLRALAGE